MAMTDVLREAHGNVLLESPPLPLFFHPLPSTWLPLSWPLANGRQDRQVQRRRPFSTWVRRLANFKSSSDGERTKRHTKMRRGAKLNNPYPQSGHVSKTHGEGATAASLRNNGHRESAYSFATAQTGSIASSYDALRGSADGHPQPAAAGRSVACAASETEGPRSITAPSHGASSLAGTSRTVGGGMDSRRGGDSTFSSPAPSVQSLTTTLTTIQSTTTPNGISTAAPTHSNTQSIQFSQPFPTASPAPAIPVHLAPTGHPTTYSAATANNLLTDNASILTLASSSKRRRRRSMDTDASVRALAPSSLWGGSRESLSHSVLSTNLDSSAALATPGLHGSSSRIGPERTSIYSAAGVPPTLAVERNSTYAKQGDGASVRSGLLGHGARDSISGSNAGVASPLASPREVPDEAKKEDDKDE